MTTYTDAFGGANVYPSEISYAEYTLTADLWLTWPQEVGSSDSNAARIMNIDAALPSLTVMAPDARESGTGNTILFNNIGAQTFFVKDAAGGALGSVAPGELWQLYLTDNTTSGGQWVMYQFGAGVSQANAAALAGTGLVAVGTLLSLAAPVTPFSSNYTAGVNDRAKFYNWTGAGGVLTLPDAATVGNNWFMMLRNSGSGALTVDPSGGVMIDGASTKSYQPGENSMIVSDGLAFYTLGFGQNAVFVFDYTVINVPGSGAYTLAGSELNRIVYKFTGGLTGNRSIIVPATVQQYWIDNSTTGSFTLTVKTAAGTGVTVGQATRSILYCDGTNVVDADTGTISTPISIADGGTGAVTAGAALINLGGTSLGIAVFQAASTAAAYAALGRPPVIEGGTY
jgi:hypothetical protein